MGPTVSRERGESESQDPQRVESGVTRKAGIHIESGAERFEKLEQKRVRSGVAWEVGGWSESGAERLGKSESLEEWRTQSRKLKS